jgi:hypothetical protein
LLHPGEGWIRINGDNGEQVVSSDNFTGGFYNIYLTDGVNNIFFNIGIKGFTGICVTDWYNDLTTFKGNAKEVNISY